MGCGRLIANGRSPVFVTRNKNMPVARVVLVLALFAGTTFSAEHQLRVLNTAEPIKGELVSIDSKNIVFKTADKTITKPMAEVLQLDLQAAPAQVSGNYMQVELTDGTILNCKPDGLAFNGKEVELTLLADIKVQVPLKTLSYILKNAQDAKVRENADWKMILKNRRSQDMLVIELQGRLNGIGGTVIDGKGTVVNFLVEGRDKPIARDITTKALAGCVFVNKPEPNAPVVACKFSDLNHNLLMAAQVEAKEGGDIVVTTVSGVKLTYRRDLVAKLDYNRGKLEFLSDLDATVVEEPSEDFFDRRYGRDKNREGNALQMGGVKFAKGLFLPVLTKLEYKLGGEYNEFTAQIGVDETVPGKSHVKLKIEGDGKELFSGEFKRADKRREIKLNIRDVQNLRISVEPIDPLNVFGHHLDLADAKISK
jgi:hypothetical protein